MPPQLTVFHRLSPQTLIYLSAFCDDMRAFLRLLIASKLSSIYTPDDADFWSQLLKYFLSVRDRDLESVLSNFSNMRHANHRGAKSAFYLFRDLFTLRKCSRSGCYRTYEEWTNHSAACRYHPGKLKTQVLTCCRERSFQSPGCKEGYHSGLFHFVLHSERDRSDHLNLADGSQRARPTKPVPVALPLISVHCSPSARATRQPDAADESPVRLPRL